MLITFPKIKTMLCCNSGVLNSSIHNAKYEKIIAPIRMLHLKLLGPRLYGAVGTDISSPHFSLQFFSVLCTS